MYFPSIHIHRGKLFECIWLYNYRPANNIWVDWSIKMNLYHEFGSYPNSIRHLLHGHRWLLMRLAWLIDFLIIFYVPTLQIRLIEKKGFQNIPQFYWILCFVQPNLSNELGFHLIRTDQDVKGSNLIWTSWCNLWLSWAKLYEWKISSTIKPQSSNPQHSYPLDQ